MLTLVETVAPTESTVLVCGQTGTGKELVARAVHDLSDRKSRLFVKLNCAAIPAGSIVGGPKGVAARLGMKRSTLQK